MTRTAVLTVVVLLLAACTAGPGPSSTASPTSGLPSQSPGSSTAPPGTPSPSPATPSATPIPATPPASPSPSPDTGLYLRTWLTQALPPPSTFTWLPMLTISAGKVIDGNVAVPAIYPGPLLILPFERDITADGQALVVDEARRLGLLGDVTDFTGGQLPPGSQVAHITLVVDGELRELVGDHELAVTCDSNNRCNADPGTPHAFAAFWRQLSYLDGWMATELGPTSTYQPERLALVTQPAQPDPSGLTPQVFDWPLGTDFAGFGQPFGGDPDMRCATMSGEDLDLLLPALEASNQLTLFVDRQDVARSLLARALVPDEPSPCPDEAG